MVQRENHSLSLFARIGRLVGRSRHLVLGLWILLLAVSLTLAPQIEQFLQGTGLTYEAGEARQAERLLQSQLGISVEPLIVVFQASTDLDQVQPHIQRILSKIRQLPGISPAASAAQDKRSNKTQYSIIDLDQHRQKTDITIPQVQAVLQQETRKDLKTFLTGKAAVDEDLLAVSKADLARAELIALPLTLVALLFVFGSAVAAVLPVAMGILTVSLTFGLLYFVAQQTDISVLALNFTSMLGLGLGIDYSLLIVNRFREELRHGSVSQAVTRTVETAGEAVFVSGVTVCISLFFLLLFPISVLRSISIAGGLVVLLSVAAALTLLPALLSIIGERINWGRNVQPKTGAGFWAKVANFVTRHSAISIVMVLGIVLPLSAPFLDIQYGIGDSNVLPRSVPSRAGLEQIQQAFGPNETEPILWTVHTTDPDDRIFAPQHLAALYPLVKKLEQDPRVEHVNSLLNVAPRLTLSGYQKLYQQPTQLLPPALAAVVKATSNPSMMLITVRSKTDSHDTASHALVTALRSQSIPGLKSQVGGQTAREIDLIQAVSQHFPIALAGIVCVTFVVLCLLLRSIFLPLKAILMNVLSIGASFGALVFIFQEGHFQKLLNFTPLGYLDILMPVVLFCVVFGLSMDYEVFLLTRIRESYEACGNNTRSVIEGLEHTGWTITSAASLMIIVTGTFTFTNIIFMKALGLGIAIAVLIDATLIRVILVPATMHLIGGWNWWMPAWLRPNHRVQQTDSKRGCDSDR